MKNLLVNKICLRLQNLFWKSWRKSHLPSSLLSPVTYDNVVFGLMWGSFWGGIPFEYDASQNRIKTTRDSVRRWKMVTIFHCANLFYLTGALTYLSLPLISAGDRGLGRSPSALFDNAFAFIVTMMTICLVMFNLAVGSAHRTEFCSLVNRELKYCIFLRETFTNKFGKSWKNGCEEFMIAFKTALIFPFFACLHCWQHPTNMIYMTSFISSDSMFYWTARICNSLLVLLLQISGLGTVLGIFIPVLGFVFTFLNIIMEIRAGRALYYTNPSFRHPETLRLLIRAFQVLSIQINLIGQQILMLEHAIMTLTGTACIFAVIHFWSGLTISGRGILVYFALVTIGVWSTILTVAARVYTSTEKSLNTWRNFGGWTRTEKREMAKYRRSVRPIQLQFGGFYYIRPKKILSFWNTLVWLIVRSLLTFPVSH